MSLTQYIWPELHEELEKKYFQEIIDCLSELDRNSTVYFPSKPLLFQAFNYTPLSKVKVVLLGQDPYHNERQAMGLSFSVPKNKKIPPSLKNIFKELNSDMGYIKPKHGELTAWAQQGVLLLNAILTVEHKKPGSHKNIGWQIFTDKVIQLLSKNREHLVFLLWGNFAKSKAHLIDNSKHLVLQAAHPSPLARGAFFGSKPFSKTNDYLKKKGIEPINWEIK